MSRTVPAGETFPRVPVAKGLVGAGPDRPRAALPATGLWTGQLDTVPIGRARELVAELEELGYGALWVPEVAGRDPYVHLALLLSGTRKILGATGIANIWARDPLATSCAAVALTEAFPDRILIGLGVSHQPLVNDLRGHDYRRPLSAMRSYLDGMDGAAYLGYRPATPVRYLIGALRPKMLRLAAERTDGAHPYLVTPEHTASARATMGPAALLCPEQTVVLERDPSTARALARGFLSVYLGLPNYANNLLALGWSAQDLTGGGSDALVDALVAWGDEETVQRRVKAHLDAGADHVCVQTVPATPRGLPDDQWRRLAAPLLEVTRR